MYCKGVYSEISNTKSARCSSEWSNIGFMTNLFLSFEPLLGAIFCSLLPSPHSPDSGLGTVNFRPLWSRQNQDQSTPVRVFDQIFFRAGKMIMLTFPFFYEKKMKIVFLVKYRHKVRKIISQGMDIHTIPMSSMQYY